MHPTASRLIAAALLLGLVSGALADEQPAAKQPTPPYQRGPVLYEGMASIPWSATYSGDGRLIALVEGHPRYMLKILDATTRKVLADIAPEHQPASHRPALTKDGTKLVLIEGEALVVRTQATKWQATERIPLGFTPGINRRARALRLSPNESSVAFVNDGRAYVVNLKRKRLRQLAPDGAFAVHYVGNHLAVTRWNKMRVQTDSLDLGDKPLDGILHAMVAVSRDGETQLVARKVREESARSLVVIDAATAKARFKLDLPDRELTAAGFSPDGKHLMTIQRGKVGVIYDARTGAVLQRIKEYEDDRMIGFAFSPDGKALVTSGRRPGTKLERSVLVWSRKDS